MRDVYYQDVQLFKHSQLISNLLLDLLAESLGVELCALNIFPNQKGLMYVDTMAEPTLIPINFDSINQFNPRDLKAIVVIEKDAVFKSLVESVGTEHQDRYQNVLFVTGKGFPDVLTRKFVRYLSMAGKINVLGFMDSDIYGVHIFKTYKYSDDRNNLNNYKLLGCFILEYQNNLLVSFNVTIRDFRLMINFIDNTLSLVSQTNDQVEIKHLKSWIRNTQRSMLLFKKAEMDVIAPNSSADTSSAPSPSKYILGKLDNFFG